MFVSEKIKKERRDFCFKCPNKRGSFFLFGFLIFKRIPQCNVCKCGILAKTSLEISKCPEGKW
jgi:hypothetical protein